MYSDSDDDSQLSQPHLFIKKKSIEKGNDVVDRERSSTDLINLSSNLSSTNLIDLGDVKNDDQIELIASTSKSTPIKAKSPTDRLLIKYSSSSSDSAKDRSSSSDEDETSLGEVLEGVEYDEENDEIRKLTFNKSQQTSPNLFGSFNKLTFSKTLEQSIDWNELKKFSSIQSLESTVHSPELAQFQSKYLKNWHQQQRQYYEQKQSFESLDTRFSSKLDLNFDDLKILKLNVTKEDNEKINTSFRRKQYGIYNFDFDEELFYKVKKLFPQVSEEKIRTFMYKHHNQEHDVIAATINSLSPKRERRRLKHQSAMDKVLGNYIRMHREIDQLDEERKRMISKEEKDDEHNYAVVEIKIKYLKKLYPKADELDLFYMLHNNDMKANYVAKKLEELGYQRKNLSDSEESLVSSVQFIDIMPDLKLNFDEQQDRILKLQKDYFQIDLYLIEQALKCTNFNMDEARKLLDTVDVDEYRNMKGLDFDYSKDDDKFIYKTDRGTQTNLIDYYELGDSYKIERKTNLRVNDKVNQSTWTGEDEMIEIMIKKSIAFGHNPYNQKGPAKKEK